MKKALEFERYSFSKLTSFENCKLGYFKRYIEHNRGIDNAFGQFGTFMHSILERFAKSEIDLWDLVKIYKKEFDKAVPEVFPPLPNYHKKYGRDMRQLYYDQGLDFVKNFSGNEGIKILEIESEFEFIIDDWIFNGVMDFVFEDKDGQIIILDYKTKSKFKNKKEKADFARQLYLYALQIKRKYGRYPDELRFLMVRKQKLEPIKFDIEELKRTVRWARETVRDIRDCFSYPPNPEKFFCNQLCNQRLECEFRPEENEDESAKQ